MKFHRESGLSITLFGSIAFSIAGQYLAGWMEHNEDQGDGRPADRVSVKKVHRSQNPWMLRMQKQEMAKVITTYRFNANEIHLIRKWRENKGNRLGTVIAKGIDGIVVH